MERQKRAATPQGNVTVALKLPNGLIMRLYRQIKYVETGIGGTTRDSTRAEPIGKEFKLNGNRFPFGSIPAYEIVNGYALTPNVPAEFFQQWWEANKESDLVENNLIFADADPARVRAWCKEYRSTRSGFEPLNPTGDPRAPRANHPNLKIQGNVNANGEAVG